MIKISPVLKNQINLGSVRGNQNNASNSIASNQISFEGEKKKKGLSARAALALAAMAMTPVVIPTSASAQTSSVITNVNDVKTIDDYINFSVNDFLRVDKTGTVNKFTKDANHYFYVIVPTNAMPNVGGKRIENPVVIETKQIDSTGKEVFVMKIYPNSTAAKAVQAFIAGNNGFGTDANSIELAAVNKGSLTVNLLSTIDKVTEVTVKPDVRNFTNLFNIKGSGATSDVRDFMDDDLQLGTTTSAQGARGQFNLNGLSVAGGEVSIKNISKDKKGNVYISNISASKERARLTSTTSERIISKGIPTTYPDVVYTSGHPQDLESGGAIFVEGAEIIPGGSNIERITTGDDYDRQVFDVSTTVIPAASAKLGKTTIKPYATLDARQETIKYDGFSSDKNQEIGAGLGLAAQYKNKGLKAGAIGEVREVRNFGDVSSTETEAYARGYVQQFLTKNAGVEVGGQYYKIKEEEGVRGQAGLFVLSSGKHKVRVGAGVLKEIIDAGSVDYDKTKGYLSLDAALDKNSDTIINLLGTSDGKNDNTVRVGLSRKW